MWRDLLLVCVGGGAGSAFRFLVSRFMSRWVGADWLFTGTLLVNITGCFLIGLLSGWMLAHQPDNQTFRLLFIVGFCGGYTTFSTFSFESLRLVETQQWGLFLLYASASVLLGLLAVWGGMKLAN